nr:MAG TPA: hypothetical protein [Caudoviricetes sp.]
MITFIYLIFIRNLIIYYIIVSEIFYILIKL